MANAAEKVEGIAESMEQPQPYLKLNADCWEQVYDYLLLKEIIVMGQTCKRMNQMSGYYIREYYPQTPFVLIDTEIYYEDVCIIPDFFPFIGWLSISSYSKLGFFLNDMTFESLKTIAINDEKLIGIENMQNALKQVETIQLLNCEIGGSFFAQLSNYCPKLKCLTLFYCQFLHTDLLSQYYPALESLKFRSSVGNPQLGELRPFLEKHSRLKRFNTTFENLWQYRHQLTETNVQLDFLSVCIFQSLVDSTFLKALHQRGFYKSLQLSFVSSIDASDVGRLTDALSTLPRLGRLVFYNNLPNDLSRMTDLTELSIFDLLSNANIETLAKSVPRLKRLTCIYADFDAILTFVRHSKKLENIKIFHTLNVEDFLNLDALHQERQKIENASPIEIYLSDEDYTFLKSESNSLNLSLVKIERIEVVDNHFIFLD